MKPKILFVYEHKYPQRWMDGLWAALNILEEDFDITKYNLKDDSTYKTFRDKDFKPKWDFLLGWGSFFSPVDKYLQDTSGIKKGLCIAGNAFPPTGANKYDVLFYETRWYRPQINFHKNIVHAFGINTDIYNAESLVMPGNISFATPIVWDYLGVGAFASWKRWEKMKDKKGMKMVVGEYQDNNEQESLSIVSDLIKNGVMVSDMVHPYDLSNLYRYSRICYIPSNVYGGGERAVLEAKSCGCKVEIEPDNLKLKELLEGPILDEKYYASQLKYGIESVI